MCCTCTDMARPRAAPTATRTLDPRPTPAHSPRLCTLEAHIKQSCTGTLLSSPVAPEGWDESSQDRGSLAQEVGQPRRPERTCTHLAARPGHGSTARWLWVTNRGQRGRRVPPRRPVWVCCLPVQNADPSLGHGVWSHGARKPSMRVSPSLPRYGEPPRPLARLLQRERNRHSAVCLRNAASRPPACRPGTEGEGTERDPGTGRLALPKIRTFLNGCCP